MSLPAYNRVVKTNTKKNKDKEEKDKFMFEKIRTKNVANSWTQITEYILLK